MYRMSQKSHIMHVSFVSAETEQGGTSCFFYSHLGCKSVFNSWCMIMQFCTCISKFLSGK